MLSRKDNELMCRVGPGTPMGNALRRYWTPAMQSSDLPTPGGNPRRVTLLGQNYVAFRGEDGVVGLLDEQCCHRGVSLSLGRVEGCGLRCIFHGWKFAADGEVLETPNVSDPKFRKRVRQGAYPVREKGGLIWAYLGPRDKEPPFPDYPWFDYEPAHLLNVYQVEGANFVQVLEALFDSSHLNILHKDGLSKGKDLELDFAKGTQPLLLSEAPRMEAESTEFGFHYAALRSDGDVMEARVTPYIAPYSMLNGMGDFWVSVVPIDDTSSVHFYVWWNKDKPIGEDPLRSQHLSFIGLDQPALQAFGLTYETFASTDKPSIKNGFKQDRAAMAANTTFSGFKNFTEEDAAVLMSAGALKDRSVEYLSPSDKAIVRLYRTLLEIARAGESGADPIGLNVDPSQVIGIMRMIGTGVAWQSLVPTHKKRASTVQLDDVSVMNELD